jgi:hypothetical protein
MSVQWSPRREVSAAEARVIRRCKKAKLFVFLREHRHELFDQAFQDELAGMYPERKRGREIVPPALLAMVTLLQAAYGISDEEAVRLAALDRAWQMVLDTLDDENPPFAQGTLYAFRQRLIAHDMDRRLLERTVELAKRTRAYGATALRAAFDSSPLFGAGRVEDTFNLIGHAVRDVLGTVARRLDVSLEAAAGRAGIPLVMGSSLKAALDVDWDDPKQKQEALNRLLAQVRALGEFLETEMAEALKEPPLSTQWAVVQEVIAQDLEPDPSGGSRVKQGVAKERRISIQDGQMRHGRKSRSSRVDGFKRHLALDDKEVILAAAITPANRPEGEAAGPLFSDVERQGLHVAELDIDRGYLAAGEVELRRTEGMAVHCKAFPLRNGDRFTKAAFKLDFKRERVTCPAGRAVPLAVGTVAHFPATTCNNCELRECCTRSKNGRSVSIHPKEQFFVDLRARQRTPLGRAELRRRTRVEHGLAAISRTQGRRARYLGVRKNLFDLRRHAAVNNLYVAART